jgi:hypothetical protein
LTFNSRLRKDQGETETLFSFERARRRYVGPTGQLLSWQFRICDLYAGSYRLTASEEAANPNEQKPLSYIASLISITDRDLHNLRFAAVPGVSFSGEVLWDGEPPQMPSNAKIKVWLNPILRANIGGENLFTESGIPGTFSWHGVLMDEYEVGVSLQASGLYVKDVTHAGRSVRYEPLRVGSAMGNTGLRVSVGCDGATFNARVMDKDGNPMPDMSVLTMPTEITSEAALQTVLLTGKTDQLGLFESRRLAPRKYYVAASGDSFGTDQESIHKIWQARNRFKEVELRPNASAQIDLEPVKIE